MRTLKIFIADDQIPPADVTEAEFRAQTLKKYGDTAKNRLFLDQCTFMGRVVQELRDLGYNLTTARTHADAKAVANTGDFDLAIIDLGWYMDFSLPQADRPAAGWTLCQAIEERDQKAGTTTPQIVFSSRFPTNPELSREAARRQKLPVFKEPTDTVRQSLMAAVGFVDATLRRSQLAGSQQSHEYERKLQDLALTLMKEPLQDYRRWTYLSLTFVGISLALLVAGVALTYRGDVAVATVSSVTSLVSGTVSALLYRRLGSAGTALDNARAQVLGQLEAREKTGI